MKTIRKVFVVLCLLPLFFAAAAAMAQGGRIILGQPAANPTSPKKPHNDSQLQITNYEVYLLGIGSGVNQQATSLISCDNYGVAANVGSDDGGTTCYVIPDPITNVFDLTGLYYGYYAGDGSGCQTGAATSVYLEFRKGTIGGYSNDALALMAIPPSAWNCDYIYTNASSIHFVISDFTNVMAGFGVAPFVTYSTNALFDSISAAGTNGKAVLLTGFDAIGNYTAVNNGFYGGSDTNLAKQLNTIADVISACEASTGPSSTGCTNLFSYTTNSNLGFTGTYAPFDIWQSAASMGQDPTHQVSNEFNLIVSTPPWVPNDSSAPSSWSVATSMTVSGSTVNSPVITSVKTNLGVPTITGKKTIAGYTITGTDLKDLATGTCIVAATFQKATASGANCSSSLITFTVPATLGKSAIGVYANGMVSNFAPFQITN
jgi:hypothetical protein